jgi:hypothetical protein
LSGEGIKAVSKAVSYRTDKKRLILSDRWVFDEIMSKMESKHK